MEKMILGASLRVLACGLVLGFAGTVTAQQTSLNLAPFVEHVSSYSFLATGLRASESGNTALAHASYVRAARDANKIAQFKLGLMYLEGYRGPSDPERAWAWMELSAERQYPQFREVADQLWMTFDEGEQATAQQILQEELRPVFSDKVAVPRVAAEMRRTYRAQTGTRVGFGGGSLRVLESQNLRDPPPATTNRSLLDGVVIGRDGASFYVKDKWDFHQIVAVETAIFHSGGNVTIRDEVESE